MTTFAIFNPASGHSPSSAEFAVLNPRMWSVPGAAGTLGTADIGTTATVIATSPATTYQAHMAYRLRFRGLVRTSATGTLLSMQIHDTTAVGTLRMDPAMFPVVNANRKPEYFEHIVANTAGSDISGRVLVLTIASDTSTVKVNGGATLPWYWSCEWAGLDTDFPEAVAL